MRRRICFVLFFGIAGVILVTAQEPKIRAADYTSIQAAIDAAPAGATLLLPPGEVYTHLEIRKPLTLVGAGADQTLLYYMDDPERTPSGRDIMESADASVPVIRIETEGTVILRDLEIRGAADNFTHFGYSYVGIISKQADLRLERVVLRRFGKIFAWVDNGSLWAHSVTFADNQGFQKQCDLGFQLTNLSSAEFYNFQQLSDSIDHSININDLPYGESLRRRTAVRVEDSFITASSLYWGDCIRSYGGADITVRNTLFTRDPEGEAPRTIANSGISLNGGRCELVVDSCEFENLSDTIALLTNKYGDQHYEVSISHTTVRKSLRSHFLFSGEGSAVVDIGGGIFGSTGENIFDTPSTMVRVTGNPDIKVYTPDKYAERFGAFYVHATADHDAAMDAAEISPENAGSSDSGQKTSPETVQENAQATEFSVVAPASSSTESQRADSPEAEAPGLSFQGATLRRSAPDGSRYTYQFRGLNIISALETGTYVLVAYQNGSGNHFLGKFSNQLQYESEYNFYGNTIYEMAASETLIVVHYAGAGGYHYVATFSNTLELLGYYWFERTAALVSVAVEQGRPVVAYDYTSDGASVRYKSYFSRTMGHLKAERQ